LINEIWYYLDFSAEERAPRFQAQCVLITFDGALRRLTAGQNMTAGA